MEFVEFFEKKKISLSAFERAEPLLFSEMKAHFSQMGEKSFDHTKKYWFNKLRRSYPVPPEAKKEKVHLENQLAEQTITEDLIKPAEEASTPKVGFKPRFKAPVRQATPAEQNLQDKPPVESETSTPEVNADATRHDGNPPFQIEKQATQQSADEQERTATESSPLDQPTQSPAAKPAYKPRFKMQTPPKKQDD